MTQKLLVEEIPQLINTMNILENEIKLSEFASKINEYKEKGLDLEPDFQRGYVWTEEQQVKFVEFILKGGTVNPIYFNKNEESFVIIDGKQRLNALLKFLNQNLHVFKDLEPEMNGYCVDDIEPQTFLNICKVKVAINNLQERKDFLKWYIELNSGGTTHTKEELDKVRRLIKEEEKEITRSLIYSSENFQNKYNYIIEILEEANNATSDEKANKVINLFARKTEMINFTLETAKLLNKETDVKDSTRALSIGRKINNLLEGLTKNTGNKKIYDTLLSYVVSKKEMEIIDSIITEEITFSEKVRILIEPVIKKDKKQLEEKLTKINNETPLIKTEEKVKASVFVIDDWKQKIDSLKIIKEKVDKRNGKYYEEKTGKKIRLLLLEAIENRNK
jgi:hypothetical protein